MYVDFAIQMVVFHGNGSLRGIWDSTIPWWTIGIVSGMKSSPNTSRSVQSIWAIRFSHREPNIGYLRGFAITKGISPILGMDHDLITCHFYMEIPHVKNGAGALQGAGKTCIAVPSLSPPNVVPPLWHRCQGKRSTRMPGKSWLDEA
jgi:hypothetical protein